MISDSLDRIDRYAALSPRFAVAIAFLRRNPAALPDGRHDIDGDDCFALVQSYTTKPATQAAFEAHRKYTDIQLILSGEETLLWAPLQNLGAVTQPYATEKDIAFFAPPEQNTPLNLRAGEFAIFFPEDGHAPGIQTSGACAVRKVVIKVRV
jgi:YhcH/YjgK/YiaL family protein